MKPKIIFLSRYQTTANRGAETFVKELSTRLAKTFKIVILNGFSFEVFKQKPAIIIPINGGLQSLLTKIYCIFTKTKMIISGQAGLGRPDRWNLLLRPNAFVALTEKNAAWAKKNSFKVNIKIIPNGVDLTKFKTTGKKINLPLNQPIILCVAGPEPYKRIEATIKAVAQLKNTSLLVAGGSPSSKNLGRQLLGERFLQIKFKFDQMPAVYRSVDVFTLASKSFEAFGTAYLEALASGLSVVAPNDQLRHQILGNNAIYVNQINSAKQYAAKLTKALNHKQTLPIKWLNSFSWDNIAKKYQQLCLELIG